MTADNRISAERVREVLSYDPETGIFRWKVATSSRVSVGDIAGQTTWNGYIVIGIDGANWRAHRLAWLYMTGDWPKEHTDHINGKRDDNRWSNLREATRSENNRNVAMHKNNTSGRKGIYWHKLRQKWHVTIMIDRRKIHIGYFDDPDIAAAAYRAAALKYHGPFARQ